MGRNCEALYEKAELVYEAVMLDMALVDSIGLRFSDAANSQYDLPSFLALTAAMSMHDACANEGSTLLTLEASKHVPRIMIPHLRIPTSQWGLGLFGNISHDRMEYYCNRAHDAQICALVAMGVIPSDNLVGAYDTHSSPNYGTTENPLYVVAGPHMAGTNWFVRFMTGAIVSGPYTIHSSFCRMKKGMTNAECVKRMLDDEDRRGLKFLYSIWDKGFYSVDAMIECGNRDRLFLMYAVETPKVKKAIEAYKNGERKKVEGFVVGSGSKKFAGTLAMVERTRTKKGKVVTDIIPFFSNMPPAMLKKALPRLPLEMKRRWRIETGYRAVEMAKPLTTSTRPAVRTYMFWRALTMTNLWAMVDFKIKAARAKDEEVEGEGEVEGEVEFPPAVWSSARKVGDRSDTILPGGYDITLKEFLSMYLTECTRMAIMDKEEQVECRKAAVEKYGHLFKPAARAKEQTQAPAAVFDWSKPATPSEH